MVDRNIIAIGGGGFGRSLGNLKIEKHIISLVGMIIQMYVLFLQQLETMMPIKLIFIQSSHN